jgi:hypothetical protein
MVGLGRLELPTSRLSGVRSNRAELQAPETSKVLPTIRVGQTLVRVHSIGERETKAAMPRVVLSKLRSKQKRFVSNLLF